MERIFNIQSNMNLVTDTNKSYRKVLVMSLTQRKTKQFSNTQVDKLTCFGTTIRFTTV